MHIICKYVSSDSERMCLHVGACACRTEIWCLLRVDGSVTQRHHQSGCQGFNISVRRFKYESYQVCIPVVQCNSEYVIQCTVRQCTICTSTDY